MNDNVYDVDSLIAETVELFLKSKKASKLKSANHIPAILKQISKLDVSDIHYLRRILLNMQKQDNQIIISPILYFINRVGSLPEDYIHNSKKHRVSDHCLIRFLERYYGIDVIRLKDHAEDVMTNQKFQNTIKYRNRFVTYLTDDMLLDRQNRI